MNIKDVAELLNVAEAKVTQWIEDGDLPAYQINKEYRFNREQVEKWMMEHIGTHSTHGVHRYSLYRALHKGEIYNEIAGTNKNEVIHAATEHLSARFYLDATVLTNLLLDRERLASTAIGHGIAIPHTRDFFLNHHFDIVSIVYPQQPLDFDALDGQPVDTLFFLFACEDTRHLDLIGKIAHFCHQEKNRELLRSRPSKQTLLHAIKEWEEHLP